MENEDDDDGIEEEDDEMRSLQLPDADMNVPKKVSMPPLLKNKSLPRARLRQTTMSQTNPTAVSAQTLSRPRKLSASSSHHGRPFPVDAKAAVEAARFAKGLRGQHRAVFDHGVLRPQPCRKVMTYPLVLQRSYALGLSARPDRKQAMR